MVDWGYTVIHEVSGRLSIVMMEGIATSKNIFTILIILIVINT